MLGATTKGTNADPVYVMMQEPGFKSQIWRTVRALALAFLVISAFSTLIEERGLPKGFKEGKIHQKKKKKKKLELKLDFQKKIK